MSIRKVLLAVAVLAIVAFTASAGPIFTPSTASSTLGSGNSAIAGHTGPYGTMMIDLTSPTMASITFTANPGFQFIDSGIAGVNVNATTWTASTPTATQLPGFAAFGFSTGTGHEDGFGIFNQNFNNSDGFDHAVQSLTFTLTDTSGTWANATNVLIQNLGGWFDAAHIAVCNPPGGLSCTQSLGAIVTGYAGENTLTGNTPPPIPEPGSLFLLGSAVLTAAGFVRRRIIKA